ncbi:MAG: MotA/TolQ/ExbB proton channel family protein [Sulfurimonas sp.]|nr:MotA/TolQ/ExbB proton channel family protein [Sulfurimonas sp.]
MIGTIFIIYLFFVKHNGYFASCKFMKEVDSFKKSLNQYIKNNLLIIGKKEKANASYDDFAREYTQDLRNDNFASIAAGVFPTLGILGTFISIAISMPDFSSQTSAVLEKEISLLLGGVGTAFYVSIYGIFLSIWWTYFDKTGLSKFEETLNSIKLNKKILFWNKEEIEQTYFEKSMENFEKLNQVFQNLTQDELVEKMNKTLTQRVDMFEKIISHEESAIKSVSAQMNESLRVIELAKNTNELMVLEFKEIIYQFGIASEKVEKSASSLSEISTALSVKDENLVNIASSLSSISTQNVEKIHQAIITNFEVMKKNTDQIGWSFNSYLNQFDEKVEKKMGDTLKNIDEEVVKIVSSLEEVKKLENS